MLMLAHKYKPSINTDNWLWSEKLDGVRALFKNGQFISRNDKPIYAPEDYIKTLNLNGTFDGELWMGRNQFQKTVSIVRKLRPIEEEWSQIRFRIFDCLDVEEPFTFRLSRIPMEHKLEHKLVTNIQEHFDRIITLGGEGIILRHPYALYERKRSWNLLKLKPELSDVATIIDYTEGEGKHEGVIGALICKTSVGKQFKIGTGLSDFQRLNPPKIGAKVRFKYQNLTEDSIPRFPVYDGICL